MRLSRREAILGATAGVAAPGFASADDPRLGAGAAFGFATLDIGSAAIAKRDGASLDADMAYVNRDVRFPMCSSFKWLLAARVLSRVDSGLERLDRRVAFNPADLQEYAPAAKAALEKAGGVMAEMTVDALCEAAVTLSDNTAANLLLGAVDGPTGLTTWLRGQGDKVTRLDRVEPAMNYVPLGDPRDTTTPAAMVRDVHRFLFGNALTPPSRRILMRWMLDCKTGETRVKAGLLPGWRIAQKTGTLNYRPGVRAASGDVGVVFSPKGKTILFAAYTAGSTHPQADVDGWFADIGRAMSLTPPSTGGPVRQRLGR